MLYTKIQPQRFLGSRVIFLSVFTIYGMVAILFKGPEPCLTNCQYPIHRKPHVKSGETDQAVVGKLFEDYTILYMYIPQWQGQITPRGQGFTTLNILCKFQPLVLIIHSEKRSSNIFLIPVYGDANLTLP